MPYIKPRTRRAGTRWAALRRRKGVSIVESIILMITILAAFGAIFQTMYWAQATYTFNRQNRDSREVLFNWVETFESVWPTQEAVNNPGNPATLMTEAQKCVITAGNLLGTYSAADNSAQVGGFTLEVTAIKALPVDGRIDMTVTIGTPAREFVRNLTRSYNIFTSDTVSDDALQQEAGS